MTKITIGQKNNDNEWVQHWFLFFGFIGVEKKTVLKKHGYTIRGQLLHQGYLTSLLKRYLLQKEGVCPTKQQILFKEFAALWGKFFSFRVDTFQMGFGEQKSKQEVTKVVSLVKKSWKIHTVFQVKSRWMYITGRLCCHSAERTMFWSNGS